MSTEAPVLERTEYTEQNLPERVPGDEEIDTSLEALGDEVDKIFTHEVLSEMKPPEGKDTSPGDCNDSDSHVS
jgi:hypothetical protein